MGQSLQLPKEVNKKMPVLPLISLILSTNDELDLGKLKSEFYIMFREELYHRCRSVAQKRFSNSPEWEAVAEDTVQDTFLIAFDILIKFKSDPSWTDELARKKVSAWLTSIASHRILDYYEDKKREKNELVKYKYDQKMGLQRAKTSDPKKFRTVERLKLDKAMNKLTTMQRDILLLYIEHDCFMDSKKHLPTKAMEMICKKYNTNSANVRQVKKRAWESVRKNCFTNDEVNT